MQLEDKMITLTTSVEEFENEKKILWEFLLDSNLLIETPLFNKE